MPSNVPELPTAVTDGSLLSGGRTTPIHRLELDQNTRENMKKLLLDVMREKRRAERHARILQQNSYRRGAFELAVSREARMEVVAQEWHNFLVTSTGIETVEYEDIFQSSVIKKNLVAFFERIVIKSSDGDHINLPRRILRGYAQTFISVVIKHARDDAGQLSGWQLLSEAGLYKRLMTVVEKLIVNYHLD